MLNKHWGKKITWHILIKLKKTKTDLFDHVTQLKTQRFCKNICVFTQHFEGPRWLSVNWLLVNDLFGFQVLGIIRVNVFRYLSMVLKRLLSAPPLSPEAPEQQLCCGHHVQNAPFLLLHLLLSNHTSNQRLCFKAACEPACTNEACWSVYLNRDGHVGRRAVFLAGWHLASLRSRDPSSSPQTPWLDSNRILAFALR